MNQELLLLAPEALLALGALLLPGLYLATHSRRAVGYGGVALLLLTLATLLLTWSYPETAGLPGHGEQVPLLDHLEVDVFSQLFKALFLLAALGAAAASLSYLGEEQNQAEFYTLLLIATLGMLVVASASDLLTLFVGLELAAFSSYALVAFRKRDDLSTEAGARYFLIGAFSSALTLYGLSLLFAMTGSLTYDGVAAELGASGFSAVTFMAILCIIAGLGFKVASVPFHAWAPDVYQGAPTPVAAFLAAGSKAMGFVALFRLFLVVMLPVIEEWQLLLGILALATMTLGNLVAIRQDDIARMLAYSSIAQAGYLLMALPAASEAALAGAIAHTVMHLFMKGGAFLVVAAVGLAGLGYRVASFKGLGRRAPLLAFAMTIFMLSLAGLPPLGGFLSKFWLFYGVLGAGLDGHPWLVALVVAAVLNSALSLYYYLRVIRYMYLFDPADDDGLPLPHGIGVPVYICLALLLVVLPVAFGPFFELCRTAAAAVI